MSIEFTCEECGHDKAAPGSVLTKNIKKQYDDGTWGRFIDMFRDDTCLECYHVQRFLFSSRKACKGCN